MNPKESNTEPEAAGGIRGGGLPGRLGAWSLPLLIAAAALVPFWPALDNEFVNWDDGVYLTEHDNYHGLGWGRLRWMFTTRRGGPYQPLGWLTWALDYRLWGMNPRGYHLTNMLVHAAGAAVIYLAAALVLRRALTPAATRPTGPVRVGACAAALLWAVHPLRVESVAWATERRDVLSGLFYFLSVLAYLRWCDRPAGSASSRKLPWPLGAFLLFVGALLSKGMSVTLPLVLLILDLYPLRRVSLSLSSGRVCLAGPIRRVILEKVPFLVGSLVVGFVALYGVREVGAVSDLEELSPGQRAAVSCYSVCFGLFKTVLPVGLSPLYEFPVALDVVHWPYLLSALLFAVMCLLAYRWRRRWPGLTAAWAAYLVMLAPVSGLLHAGPQIVADRYTYLATTGPMLLLGGCFARTWAERRRNRLRIALGAGFLGLVGVLGSLAWRQTLVWRNSTALWERVYQMNPHSWHANNNLGICRAEAGLAEEALALYRHAIQVKPGYASAHYNLAMLLTRLGYDDEAIANYEAALQLNPDYPKAYTKLGDIHLRRNQLDKAVEFYRQALQLEADEPASLNNLGRALTRLGRPDEAIPLLERAAQVAPDALEPYHNLGMALEEVGRVEEAIASYRRCGELDPDHFNSAKRLGDLLVARGRFPEAVEPLQRVARLRPDDVQSQTNLGYVLTEARRYRRASEVLSAAHQQAPEHLATLLALARLQAASPVGQIRDGAAAVTLALKACARTAYRSARSLDILGAAYAEAGQFAAAADAAGQAARLAREAGRTQFAEQIEARRVLYISGRPYRLPAGGGP